MCLIYYFIFCLSMSILKELTEQATTDRQDTNKLAHLKTFTFFIFYKNYHQLTSFHALQKLSFKLKDQKSINNSEVKGDARKQAQLMFYNLQSQKEKNQGLLDLKMTRPESKTKIVAYCSEETLLDLILMAMRLHIDMNTIPIILIHAHPISDFSIFSGWNNAETSAFSEMSLSNLENLSKKWIQSAQQKVDVWRARIRWKKSGRLQKLVGQNFQTIESGTEFQQLFLSHFSLGYHVRLSKNYLLKKKTPDKRTTNSLIYGWERFKNFCCLGSSNMRTSTGVVNINYVDDKGHQFEILKHLRQYDGSEQSEVEASRAVKSDKDITSLLITNIDRFHGKKIEGSGGKPGDRKIEIVLFEGANKSRRIGSVSGAVVLKIESEMIELQIGESIYRCWGGEQIRIEHGMRVKIAINHEVLEC